MHVSFISTTIEKTLAYLDPVSGGVILQALLGILLVITLFVRAFWRRIKSFLDWVIGKPSMEEDKLAEMPEQEEN
jgi:hypothetical protein